MKQNNSIPNLEPRFLEPQNWQWGHFEREPRRRIHYGFALPDASKAMIIALPGLNEFAEKYFELAHWALEHNFGFAVIDWFGQGRSGRPLKNPLNRHSFGFEKDIEDLHTLLSNHLPNTAPKVMLAHSMGGNIGFRYIQKNPRMFTCAAFTAPMFGIQAIKALPKPLALALSSLLNLLIGKFFTSPDGRVSERQNQTFKNNRLTSDPERFALTETWMNHDLALRVGDVTYGWVYHALRSCLAVQKTAHTIEIPCLFALAGKESITDNIAARHVISQIPQANILNLAESLHEILMERDEIRQEFLNTLLQFLEENGIGNPESLKPA